MRVVALSTNSITIANRIYNVILEDDTNYVIVTENKYQVSVNKDNFEILPEDKLIYYKEPKKSGYYSVIAVDTNGYNYFYKGVYYKKNEWFRNLIRLRTNVIAWQEEDMLNNKESIKHEKEQNIAIYAGSFDPFTNGHLDIVRKASKLFDKVIILISINNSKTRHYSTSETKIAIEKILEREKLINVSVDTYNKLVVDYARLNKANYLVRGLRNNTDYNYEENIAEVNKLLGPDITPVYFRAENVAISSSMVRELHSLNHDITEFIPPEINDLINKYTK